MAVELPRTGILIRIQTFTISTTLGQFLTASRDLERKARCDPICGRPESTSRDATHSDRAGWRLWLAWDKAFIWREAEGGPLEVVARLRGTYLVESDDSKDQSIPESGHINCDGTQTDARGVAYRSRTKRWWVTRGTRPRGRTLRRPPSCASARGWTS